MAKCVLRLLPKIFQILATVASVDWFLCIKIFRDILFLWSFIKARSPLFVIVWLLVIWECGSFLKNISYYWYFLILSMYISAKNKAIHSHNIFIFAVMNNVFITKMNESFFLLWTRTRTANMYETIILKQNFE